MSTKITYETALSFFDNATAILDANDGKLATHCVCDNEETNETTIEIEFHDESFTKFTSEDTYTIVDKDSIGIQSGDEYYNFVLLVPMKIV